MSENIILAWAQTLTPAQRGSVIRDLIGHSKAPAATLLGAFAKAVGLSAGEVAGLLPGGLLQAQIAANRLMATGIACSPSNTPSGLDSVEHEKTPPPQVG